MSDHTPGPWRYMAGTHSLYDGDGKAIALVYGPRGIDCSRRDANARLIAAAPELLEALVNLLPLAEFGAAEQSPPYISVGLIEAARAAITKATGGNDE